MSVSNEKWIDALQFSSLFWPPPQDEKQRQAQVLAYVEYFSQFTTEEFPEDITQLIQTHYPSKEKRLLDEVLAIFILHHPEHGRAVVHPILSLIIDGTLVYGRNDPPFSSFISLVSQNSEKEYSEQWALACGEILRILTHYNRPNYKVEYHNSKTERSNSGNWLGGRVVDAICNVVSASPTKASTAIVLQAEKDVQPRIARDDEQGGQRMWRINHRIVKLMVELMRNHASPEALMRIEHLLNELRSSWKWQLNQFQLVLLSYLLKCRLSATIRCLSHPSMRALFVLSAHRLHACMPLSGRWETSRCTQSLQGWRLDGLDP
ncbi:hypothetical protein OPV22_023951 [Ensete ventricosum]|uniref:Gigantea n=1 Tax=Ensete ventricosum TaxID=4639 RepID=A0AAV8QTD4_ENSVE|nr:hypothetical protein OPV22_023951 [Ensete ventricosum]